MRRPSVLWLPRSAPASAWTCVSHQAWPCCPTAAELRISLTTLYLSHSAPKARPIHNLHAVGWGSVRTPRGSRPPDHHSLALALARTGCPPPPPPPLFSANAFSVRPAALAPASPCRPGLVGPSAPPHAAGHRAPICPKYESPCSGQLLLHAAAAPHVGSAGHVLLQSANGAHRRQCRQACPRAPHACLHRRSCRSRRPRRLCRPRAACAGVAPPPHRPRSACLAAALQTARPPADAACAQALGSQPCNFALAVAKPFQERALKVQMSLSSIQMLPNLPSQCDAPALYGKAVQYKYAARGVQPRHTVAALQRQKHWPCHKSAYQHSSVMRQAGRCGSAAHRERLAISLLRSCCRYSRVLRFSTSARTGGCSRKSGANASWYSFSGSSSPSSWPAQRPPARTWASQVRPGNGGPGCTCCRDKAQAEDDRREICGAPRQLVKQNALELGKA